MSAERKTDGEGFIGRWSRRKTEARESPAQDALRTPVKSESDDAAPHLPPVEELTLDSDFRGFFHPKVDENLRRSALRKLFSDPHFNVMDGLDVYIDDYSKTEPIPAAMLAGLKQAQRILTWAQSKDYEDAPQADAAAENGQTRLADAPANTPDTPAEPPADALPQHESVTSRRE